MIARCWRGATRATDADAYVDYLGRTGFAEYRTTPGNRGVLALRRVHDGKAEFVLISLWESLGAVGEFAGSHLEQAVFYPEDDRFLIERDLEVTHHEIVFDDRDATDGRRDEPV